MSEDERWLYEEAEINEKRERSQPKVIVSLKGDYTYRFVGGREEVVDLSKIGVYDLCCPHIKNIPGADVLKRCELQPVTYMTMKGQIGSYATCGPLAYINHWKACPCRSVEERSRDGV